MRIDEACPMILRGKIDAMNVGYRKTSFAT